MVVAEQGVKPAERVVGVGLPVLVAGDLVQVKGVLGVIQARVCGGCPAVPQVGQAVMGVAHCAAALVSSTRLEYTRKDGTRCRTLHPPHGTLTNSAPA